MIIRFVLFISVKCLKNRHDCKSLGTKQAGRAVWRCVGGMWNVALISYFLSPSCNPVLLHFRESVDFLRKNKKAGYWRHHWRVNVQHASFWIHLWKKQQLMTNTNLMWCWRVETCWIQTEITVSVPCLLPHLCCCCCCFVHFSKQPGGLTLFSLFPLLLFCEVGLSLSFICSVFIGKAGDSCGIFCLCVLKLHLQRMDLIPLGKENTQIYLKTKRVVLCIYFCHVFCLLVVFSFFGSVSIFVSCHR